MWAASVVSRSWLECILGYTLLYWRTLNHLNWSLKSFYDDAVAVLLQRCCKDVVRDSDWLQCQNVEKITQRNHYALCTTNFQTWWCLDLCCVKPCDTIHPTTFNSMQPLLDWVPCTMPLMEAQETRYEPGSYDQCGNPSWSQQLNGSHHLHPIELPDFFYWSTLPDQWAFLGWKIE